MWKYHLFDKLAIGRILDDNRGQGMTEYALILGLVVILGVAVLADDTLQVAITALFSNIALEFANAF